MICFFPASIAFMCIVVWHPKIFWSRMIFGTCLQTIDALRSYLFINIPADWKLAHKKSKSRRHHGDKPNLSFNMYQKKCQQNFWFAPLQHFWSKNAPSNFRLFYKLFKVAAVCLIRCLPVHSQRHW